MDVIHLLLAALPIALIAGLLALRVKPVPAVLGTIAVTLALSIWFPITPAALESTAHSLLLLTVAVVLIIFGGILLAEFLAVSGAQERIGGWLGSASHGRDRAVLLLGLGVTPLAESIIGWGVGVIIGIPLLMRVGLTATKAATIGLLSIVLAPWGSLGPGLLVMAEMSGHSLRDVGVWSAVLNLPVLLVMGIIMSIVGMGRRGALRMAGETLTVVFATWGALIATNAWVSVPLGGILASLAACVTVLLLARLRGGPIPAMRRETVRSLLPYILLIGAMLAMTALTSVVDLGAASAVLTSPALWLLVSAAAAPALLGIGRADATASIRSGLRLFWPVCVVTVLFIVFGGLLAANGMSTTLAQGAAMLGGGFLLVVPAIGLIGGYVTASNTATAAMFAAGVSNATVALGANPLVALGAQNIATGAAVMISPSRVALALSVANGLRRDTDAAVDAGRVIRTALIANGVVLVLLAPLTLLLATATG
ncbi:lactate permease [Homoserinimonas aerilata]|uniref:L-lactate permease n=1 Tax=Homoserinimonas aerilata TaxID=1162970 RepID=A0A542XX71_9MICO|nr:L-lactate permease [Homoserinimonas aerilata]TQL40441.1 lactate permease [Homoserinimonas aerilata]